MYVTKEKKGENDCWHFCGNNCGKINSLGSSTSKTLSSPSLCLSLSLYRVLDKEEKFKPIKEDKTKERLLERKVLVQAPCVTFKPAINLSSPFYGPIAKLQIY